MATSPAFSLVLSGGGLKGLAHIGVLRALEERGLTPGLTVGVSMGSLIAGAWASGRSIRELESRALALTRKDVFRIAHVDMALRRMLSPAVYRRDPLDRILEELIGTRRFRDLPHRLLVNTVDLNSGRQILWGLPGLDDASVSDAVFASCALPGILPPRLVNGHLCADGAVTENLPVLAAAAVGTGPVIAVDLSGGNAVRQGIERTGFAATYSRGLELVMGRLVEHTLHQWTHPPMVLIRPSIDRIQMFAFNRTPYLIAEGYRATLDALDRLPDRLEDLSPGIHPRREVEVAVDRGRCVGCGLCAAQYPEIFAMADGKASVRVPRQIWSPLGDAAVRACPTEAISAVEPRLRRGGQTSR
jgi:NTE family protein